MWEVVGGTGLGGIIVREGKDLKSTQTADRLSTGAIVREESLVDGRLQYTRVSGTGPDKGWVSLKLKDKDLLMKSSKSGSEDAPGPVVSPVPARPTLPIGLMFPGQGSQYVKMLADVKDIPAVAEMLEKSKGILGWDVLDLCLNGPEEKLAETRYTQAAMFIGGLAGLEKLRAEREEAVSQCQVMAGLSLGEYTALCAAGVFTFEDALSLVKLRGEAMQEAAETSPQLMLSVAGLDQATLEKLCKDAIKKEGRGAVCQIANSLFAKGYAVAGSEKAIKHLEETAVPAGALQAKVLKTSGAFHTSLMQPAANKLGAKLDEIRPRMSPPSVAVFANATAAKIAPGTSPDVIVDLLKRQLTSSVLWEASVKAMIADGVKEFYEVGPMKQLSAMMKRIDPSVWKSTKNIVV